MSLHPTFASILDAHTAPRLGAIRVNSTEYDGEIVIEQFGYWSSGKGWAVPAWEEMGEPQLAGPFASVEAASRALKMPR